MSDKKTKKSKRKLIHAGDCDGLGSALMADCCSYSFTAPSPSDEKTGVCGRVLVNTVTAEKKKLEP
jgi:hypothetical protein